MTLKPVIIIPVWPNEGTRMQLVAQLSYQQSLEQPRIVDDSPKAEEPNEKSDKTVIKKKKKNQNSGQ